MTPLLFPVIMILYSEFSSDKDTRLFARVSIFTYLMALVVSLNFPVQSFTLLIVLFVYLIGYSILLWNIKHWRVRVLLIVLILLQSVNYISLYFVSYQVYYLIPFYMEYSNIILRELTVLATSICCIEKADLKLKIGIFGAYLIEYSYLIGT